MTGQTSPTNVGFLNGGDVASILEARIVSDDWKAGSRLPSERVLSAEYGVSRPVIREALKALQERGLITVSAGRGSFVRESRPTQDGGDAMLLARRGGVTARHLVEARAMLEGRAAAMAAENRSEADLAAMRKILKAFETERGVAKAADLDVAFHESIAIASRNPVIQIMFGSIRELAHGVMLRSLTDLAVRGAAVPLHNVILDSIANQDADSAQTAMHEHLDAARRFYGADLDLALSDVLMRRAAGTPDIANVLLEVGHHIADIELAPRRDRD